jgi:hypothetical protein
MTRRKGASLFFLAGFVLGASSLIRPAAIAVTVVLAAIVWLLRREIPAGSRTLLILALVFGNAVAILPWEAWVYSKTQRIVPLSSGGHLGMLDGLTFGVVKKDYRQTFKVESDVAALMEEIQALRSDPKKTGSLGGIVSVIVEKLRSEPATVLQLYLLKAGRAWYATDSGRFEVGIMAIQAAYLVLIVWGGIGTWKIGGKPKELAISVLALVLYFWMMTTIVLSILRYMVPVIGLSMILVPGFRAKWARAR